jgi:hypothetical protein
MLHEFRGSWVTHLEMVIMFHTCRRSWVNFKERLSCCMHAEAHRPTFKMAVCCIACRSSWVQESMDKEGKESH